MWLENEVVKGNTIDEVWGKWFDLLRNESKGSAKSRDGSVVGEVINAVTVIEDPTRCILRSKIRNMPIRYAIGEFLWYLSGNNKLSAIQNYTSNWDRMSDDGETVNSNYGWCIFEKYGFNQLDFVYDKLLKDKLTRQAVIHIKDASEVESKDVNCTICLQFFIRNEKLYMTTYMRSNDIWLGFPFDVFQFTNLQIILAMKLNVGIGTYTHIAGSLHLYERDLKNAKLNIENMEVKE